MLHDSRLETPRLWIRPFVDTDAPRLIDLFADVRVHRYVGDGEPLSPANAALWVANSRANLARHGYGTGAIVEKTGGPLIGWAGFARPDPDPEEIIYGLDPAVWGRGHGTEVLAAMVEYGDTVLQAETVRATVDPANAHSIKMLVRQGFELAEPSSADSHLYIRRRLPSPSMGEGSGLVWVGHIGDRLDRAHR